MISRPPVQTMTSKVSVFRLSTNPFFFLVFNPVKIQVVYPYVILRLLIPKNFIIPSLEVHFYSLIL